MSNYPLATSTWDDKELQAIQSVIDKDIYSMSDSVAQFEQDFARFINRKYCIMASSGSAANLIATAALFYTKNPMLKKGDEVIVPAVSWSTTYFPLQQYGLKLKFVDIDLDTLNYDLEALVRVVAEYTTLHLYTNSLPKEYHKLKEYLIEKLEKFYEDKISILDKTQRDEAERSLYIQILDENWREHLYQMDILKTGIGLRGYNQKDPLVEYKKESFNLFNELIEKVRVEYMKVIHSLQIKFEEPSQYRDPETGLTEEEMIKAIEEFNKQMAEDEEFGDIFREEVVTNQKKPKRNDPCPCGSGKKYKNCCGKSGPKKGVLASE